MFVNHFSCILAKMGLDCEWYGLSIVSLLLLAFPGGCLLFAKDVGSMPAFIKEGATRAIRILLQTPGHISQMRAQRVGNHRRQPHRLDKRFRLGWSKAVRHRVGTA